MNPTAAVRTLLVALGALATAHSLSAQPAREATYFTSSEKLWRADLSPAVPTSAVVAFEHGASLKGLAARYDGNGAVTLLVANGVKLGDVRGYSCPSATDACTKLGAIAALKHARAVSLDTAGNAYAVNADHFGADQLLYLPRNPACAVNPAAAGCKPGGYGPALVLDDKVDGTSLLADVEVVNGVGSFGARAKYGPGDVLVLAAKPQKLLVYSRAEIAAYLAGSGPRPVPSVVTSDFDCEEPKSFALFPTGELLVATDDGRILVYRPDGTRQPAPFVDLHDETVGVAVGVTGGAGADPVSGGRVLVTLRSDDRLVSLGVTRGMGGELLAPAGGPSRSLATHPAFGVGDASLAGTLYTPASAGPLTVALPSHEVTLEKVNTPGFLQGNYHVISEASVRAARDATCRDGKLTVEGVTRCVPWYVRGYALNSTCLDDGSGNGCFYLVFSADTGANLFGGTQEHHFEEHEFGFVTSCYISDRPGAGPAPKQPRTFHATDNNDPAVVEDLDLADISTGCASHIGRGGEFSLFVTGWDARRLRDIVSGKLDSLEHALNGHDAEGGGLAPYIDPAVRGSKRKKHTLAYWLEKAEDAWECKDVSGTKAALDAFLALVRSKPGAFTEQPAGLPARNTPGELVARAESAWFLACGAKESCQRRLDEH